LLSKAYAKERAALIDPTRASTTFIAGDPLKYDSKVKQWTFWKANVENATTARRERGDEPSAGD
jgi:gamma-glutamyltranspeptidase/glutathione hydrolase